MQIISQGEEKLKKKEHIITCDNCNCIFSYSDTELIDNKLIRCPWCGQKIKIADVLQLVEECAENAQVGGSIPPVRKNNNYLYVSPIGYATTKEEADRILKDVRKYYL